VHKKVLNEGKTSEGQLLDEIIEEVENGAETRGKANSVIKVGGQVIKILRGFV